MRIKDMILLIIDGLGGTVSSKTKIHKLCYLYSVATNKDIGFKPHYYGPYSPTVENALDELRSIGLLDINKQMFGFDHRGFEVVRYDYSINEYSRDVINHISVTPEVEKLQNFVAKIKEIGDPDYFELAVAAKAYYVLKKESKHLTSSSITEKAKEFAWDISLQAVNKAIELLVKFELVEKETTNNKSNNLST